MTSRVSCPKPHPFEALVTVGGRLRIEGNTELTSLEALSSLTTVGEELWIESNASLTTLGLDQLSEPGSLFVLDNQTLPTCAAVAIRDRLQGSGWTGEVKISGNDDESTCD